MKNGNKIGCFIAAIAAVLLSACSQDDVQGGQSSSSQVRHTVTVSANAGEGTRAVFATNLKSNSPYYWQDGDAIGVSASGTEKLYQLDLKSRSANMLNATFSGDIEGELGDYAVYPYNENHKISGTQLTYHLPSKYTYDSWDTDFAANSDKVDDQKISASPALWAKIADGADGSSVQFKHLCGLLCIKIDKMQSNISFLTITADRQICGDFKVDLSSYEPKIESDEDNTDVPDSLKTVTITAEGVYGTSAVFYIPMPVGEDYKINVKLGYYTVKNLEMSSCTPAKTLEIERGKIKIATITQSKMHQGGYKVVYGHKFIDLGLSKMWADTNVGANVAADYGDHFSWAETYTKKDYSVYSDYHFWDDDYTYCKYYTDFGCEKYQDDPQMTLSNGDDAAYVVWGQFCKMPTKSEVEELINGTTQKEASRKNSSGETVSGLEFTSKTNGNSIFFPYNGYRDDRYTCGGGTSGHYWTSTSGDTQSQIGYSEGFFGITSPITSYKHAYKFNFSQSGINIHEEYRNFGQGVRPVLK